MGSLAIVASLILGWFAIVLAVVAFEGGHRHPDRPGRP
jgi:hypothetical protein